MQGVSIFFIVSTLSGHMFYKNAKHNFFKNIETHNTKCEINKNLLPGQNALNGVHSEWGF